MDNCTKPVKGKKSEYQYGKNWYEFVKWWHYVSGVVDIVFGAICILCLLPFYGIVKAVGGISAADALFTSCMAIYPFLLLGGFIMILLGILYLNMAHALKQFQGERPSFCQTQGAR